MFFTLVFAISTAFTIHVASVIAYTDTDGNEYKGYEPVNEKLQGVILKKSSRKEENQVKHTYTPVFTSYNISKPKIIPISVEPIIKKPIKTINDPFFLKHINRICELEAITHKSILDMYDHEPIFAKFPDLKGLAKNLAWEQQMARQR